MKLKLPLFSALIPLASTVYTQRIAVSTPDTADIVAALGALDEVVGRDQTVQNPALKNKPSIGIHRCLTVEPIVTTKPDIAIGSWMAQPVDIFAHLQKAGIKIVNVAPDDSIAAYPQSIRNIGQLIGKSAQADKLASRWQADIKQQPSNNGRYLLSYGGRTVSGKNTAADEIIHRAGDINAAAVVDGLKSMTCEAWIAAKPDIIIITDHNTTMIGNVKTFTARPEIAGSPAAKNGKICLWKANDMFRYGLDTPQVIQRLHGLMG